MFEHLVDRPPADPCLSGDPFLGNLLVSDTATDVRPLRDLAIHEVLRMPTAPKGEVFILRRNASRHTALSPAG